MADSEGGGYSTGSGLKKRRKTATDDEGNKVSRPCGAQYHCDYCRKDISAANRIKCAECTDFDLCLECFSVGVEIGLHKNFHSYHVMDQLNFPIFSADWGADEELLLLEAVEMYGMGNWIDISDHIGSKTAQECSTHYFATYINTPNYPLPDMTKRFSEPVVKQDRKAREPDAKKTGGKATQKPMVSAPIHAEGGAGYMPKRREFETEWENDAETLISEMEFTDEDPESLRELKLKILEIYNRRLDDRYRKRKFAIDNKLYELKKERKMPKQYRALYGQLKKFLKLWTWDDHDAFIKGLLNERHLRERLETLKEYRRKGITALKDAETYDAEKHKRMSDQHLRRRDALHATQRTSKYINRDRDEGTALGVGLKGKVKKKASGPSALDLTGAPDLDLLSDRERAVCSQLRLYPQQYLLIKETLLRENLKNNNTLKKLTARHLIKIDVNKTSRIFDFFEEAGWINQAAQDGQG